jgi:very-short-patch-repair endonuclease
MSTVNTETLDLSDSEINATLKHLLAERGLPQGSSLENRVTWFLHKTDVLDRMQYKLGPYRLDYAWPDLLVNLEADGEFHQLPNIALKDAERDRYLRAHGWLVFRVDPMAGNLEAQLHRVVRVIVSMTQHAGIHEWGSSEGRRNARELAELAASPDRLALTASKRRRERRGVQ